MSQPPSFRPGGTNDETFSCSRRFFDSGVDWLHTNTGDANAIASDAPPSGDYLAHGNQRADRGHFNSGADQHAFRGTNPNYWTNIHNHSRSDGYSESYYEAYFDCDHPNVHASAHSG